MKRIATLLLFSLSVLSASSQQTNKTEKKYQGLLWEITGNGLTKPSYLFGTMHVSNKLAFHLADSFYYAIKSVDVVALETNPANWQDDFTNTSTSNSRYSAYDYFRFLDVPNDYLRKKTFALDRYEGNIKLALATEPAMINGMLYRTYNQGADFEEDTYLDMYIFQTGSKLGKKMTGVENFEESEKLVAEAYKDEAKERRSGKREENDYNYEDYIKSPYTIEDAYRKGDLDLLDSMENRQFGSKAFLEKFLYKRNEIQANSIDSIVKSKSSLFVGVGSAHLPGKRGVIELLRKKGYKLRPVKMGERDGQQKDVIDKIRVPVSFKTISADDQFFTVDIPGNKMYSFSKLEDLNTRQYADMGNGAYYVVSRVKTDGILIGDNENAVYKKLDSLLYENIPGKIVRKTAITKNGYKGFDVVNRTRRGDIQRYNIFVTSYEVLFFKISGIGDYVNEGTEADHFFNSVSLKPAAGSSWTTFSPATGGFQVFMPQTPVLQKDFDNDRLEYNAVDSKENISYSLMKANIQNYGFIEEDTFDLTLMGESFAAGNGVEKEISHQLGKWQGYPVLNSKYKHKDGSTSTVRFLLQGPNYYAQVAHYNTETKNVKQYFDSFRIVPYVYPEAKLRTDTSLHFTVQSPIFPTGKKQNELADYLKNVLDEYGGDDESSIPKFGMKLIGNDTIGEKIFVAWARPNEKMKAKDSADLFSFNNMNLGSSEGKKQTYLYLKKDSGITDKGVRYMFQQVTDTNSSRTIISKGFYKNGNYFAVITLTDTLTPQSSFLTSFFSTFKVADTLKGESPFAKDNTAFFKDFNSTDSATHAKAIKRFSTMTFDSADVPALKKVIDTLSWKSKNYLQLKQKFIKALPDTKDSNLVPYLKQLYVAAKDTADLQNAVLSSLLEMRTTGSFTAFKDLVITEPPVVTSESGSSRYQYDYSDLLNRSALSMLRAATKRMKSNSSDDDHDWYPLYDTLSLSKVVFPDILQLINLDDYKSEIMNLLSAMADSGYVGMKDYESYFAKFYVEAKQELKKERAAESQQAIAKAEKANVADKDDDDSGNKDSDDNNDDLEQYAVLLMPFWDKNPGVPVFFNDIMKLKNKQIRFNIMLLLLRNKKPVSDSLINAYAADDEYRIDLFRKLKKAKLLDKFPAKYYNQADLVRSALYNEGSSYNRADTLVYLDKLPAVSGNKKGVVYFYKYKSKKESKKWYIKTFGLQPENVKEFDDDNDDYDMYQNYSYSENLDNKLDDTKPVKEQLQKLLKILQYKQHPAAEMFYRNNYDDDVKDIITERIKTSRYGD
ncbi:MAG: TraB/GumN family protein [Bacteroidetes bacterium]|nr:TraB/GumN family protein [Bacteroidota bacterium]